MKTSYEKLVEHFKTASALASAVGVGRAAISRWKDEGIPPGRALQLERVSGGVVTAQEILEERMVSSG